jgi:hypothetical protein
MEGGFLLPRTLACPLCGSALAMKTMTSGLPEHLHRCPSGRKQAGYMLLEALSLVPHFLTGGFLGQLCCGTWVAGGRQWHAVFRKERTEVWPWIQEAFIQKCNYRAFEKKEDPRKPAEASQVQVEGGPGSVPELCLAPRPSPLQWARTVTSNPQKGGSWVGLLAAPPQAVMRWGDRQLLWL